MIVRNVAAGSFSKKLGIEEGTKLLAPTLEFSYKNDDLGDPMINDYFAIAIGAATREEIDKITEYTFKVNEVLRKFFDEAGIELIDFKIEFGRFHGEIILADEISPDTCRLWDKETHEKLDKDRFRRDMGNVEDAYQESSDVLELNRRSSSMNDFEKVVTGLGEECGVFGAYDMDGQDVASSIYYGLFALQHRGQESCGIAVTDTYGQRKVLSRKGLGHVDDVFNEETLRELKGNLGVGHVRYSTAGGTRVENAQPLVINYVKGTLAIAHNGNLVNAVELREELSKTGAIFQTTIDSEVIAYHVARERLNVSKAEDAVKNAMKKIKGAYALVISSPRKMIGARDPFGLKPLCIGKRDNTYFLASESCAIAAVGAEFVRDVLPGEIVSITKHGMSSDMSMALPEEKRARCIFEYIYFARTDSTIDGVGVYHSRIVAGKALAQSYPVEADLVVGVPDSGLVAAMGYSQQSGIPYGTAFHKNSYVGRTFIKPKQSERVSSVKIKLNVIPEVVKGKRIVMVDDSIVRGTTCANIIKMLKKAGATEVHVRISSPPFLHPCYFGTDVPSNEQLIAHSHTTEEIREMIGADSLGYMEVEKLKDMVGDLKFCDACFTGNYPMEVPGEDISLAFE